MEELLQDTTGVNRLRYLGYNLKLYSNDSHDDYKSLGILDHFNI